MGRKKIWNSVSALQQAIDDYFTGCEPKPLMVDGKPVLDKNGEPVLTSKPPTITGLALALGFNSRQTLLNYQSDDKFMDTITRAKSRVEEYAEARLFDRDGANGAKFSLANNFRGWREQSAMELSGGAITVNLTDDQGGGESDGEG